jgi:hypothetical protein
MAISAENYLFDQKSRLFALRWFHFHRLRQSQRQHALACVESANDAWVRGLLAAMKKERYGT